MEHLKTPGPWVQELLDNKPKIRFKHNMWLAYHPLTRNMVAGRPFVAWRDAVEFVFGLWATAVERDIYYWRIQAENKRKQDNGEGRKGPRYTLVISDRSER